MQLNRNGRLKIIVIGLALGAMMGSGVTYAQTTGMGSSNTKTPLMVQQQLSSNFATIKTSVQQVLGQIILLQAKATSDARIARLSLNNEQQMEQEILETSHVIYELANRSQNTPRHSKALHSNIRQIQLEILQVQSQSQNVKAQLSQWSTVLKQWRQTIQQMPDIFLRYTSYMKVLHFLSISVQALPIAHEQQRVTQSNAKSMQETTMLDHSMVNQTNIRSQTNAIQTAIVQHFG
jgi:hypothetical protein